MYAVLMGMLERHIPEPYIAVNDYEVNILKNARL